MGAQCSGGGRVAAGGGRGSWPRRGRMRRLRKPGLRGPAEKMQNSIQEVAWSGDGEPAFPLTACQEMRKQEMSSPIGGN